MTAGDTLWTPPSISYTWRNRAGGVTTLEDITSVEFTAHHVVFRRGDRIVLAEHADAVLGLTQSDGDSGA